MDVWRFSFITLSMTVLLWSALPPVWILPPLLILTIILALYYQRWWLSGAFAAIFWMASVGHWQQAWQLPQTLIQKTVLIEGQVSTLTRTEPVQRFTLRLLSLENQSVPSGVFIRLSYRNPSWPLKQGQRLRLAVRLKPPHGSVNLGGFNYQRWLFANGIKATGYVVQQTSNELIGGSISLRQQLRDNLAALELKHGAWLQALTLGYRGALEAEDWQLVQQTGVAHLIAISGLHLGIISGLSLSVLVWTSARVVRGSSEHANLLKWSMGGALIVAAGYAALAGFSLPTARAWVMLALVTWLWLSDRHWRPRQIVLSTLLIFILLFPLSLFSFSFWLSFSAIAIIWLVFWRWPVASAGLNWHSAMWVLLRMQLALSVMMLPLVAWEFNLVSVVAPLVNLLAVPLVTLLLVPLCLLGLALLVVWPGAARQVFSFTDTLLELGIAGLQWCANWQSASFAVRHIPLIVWIVLVVALIIGCLPLSRWKWLVSLICCLPLLSWLPPSQAPYWMVRVLDVGQGLAVVVERRGRAILYDTGPAYPSGYNSADSHILPLLKRQGIRQLDRVFISHHDNDHAGSLGVLQRGIVINTIVDAETGCRQPWQEQWQGLSLKVLWPPTGYQDSENNLSCVLHISDGENTLLLPGDIDIDIEGILAAGEAIQADILIAPHHGSNTSSSSAFIRAVAPKFVVFSQGYLNRWRFPDVAVAQRYHEQGTTGLQTSREGQIDFMIYANHIEVKTYRRDYAPYWYQRPPFHFHD
ncbi:DNA internalization-related competence protein ComEC/Rec2 [Lacimicrobium sp. SS2-24]|uniref:DNA internalization-related competence protein ComEC/Rec2 n=1 Tax=Lacimicrobium sp. SS2-24 TaxID=2005569 RepID=UPI000B4BA245|nr:DNA internalization-related competence protein ComEC/Rec2 [Lacimicrobium sp. SS2-24]